MKLKELKENIRTLVRKINEATFDVQTPGALNPTQKQTMISKARTTTKNPKIGTQDDPAEFIEELSNASYNDISQDIEFYGDDVDKNNMNKMSREDMLNILRINPDTDGRNLSNGDLIRLLKKTSDMYSDLNEEDYVDTDDISKVSNDFTDFNNIYEYFSRSKKK